VLRAEGHGAAPGAGHGVEERLKQQGAAAERGSVGPLLQDGDLHMLGLDARTPVLERRNHGCRVIGGLARPHSSHDAQRDLAGLIAGS
jgi:hypothetical protein